VVFARPADDAIVGGEPVLTKALVVNGTVMASGASVTK